LVHRLAFYAVGEIMKSDTTNGWQPITTAPNDGTEILIWDVANNRPALAHWENGRWLNNHYGNREPLWHFTGVMNWQPLPEAP
jgi:hypothetical protein